MSIALDAFAFLQALGAIMGAGGAVVGELAYFRAIRDGRIDNAEREHLTVIARVLRFAMITLLIASIGLVLTAFVYSAIVQPAATASYWGEMVLALVIIVSSWALSRRKISFALGSGAAFTAWWFVALMDVGQVPQMTFGSLAAYYVVAAAVIIALLMYIRSLYPKTID